MPRKKPGAESEEDFQSWVIEAAKVFGWDYYHPHDSRRSVEGYPDLTLVGHGRIMFREIKTETGTLTKAQEHWIDNINANGGDAYVWRPAMRDAIIAELRA